MTKQSFDEIIHRCCKESSDFIQQAKWELLESDEPNSVEVKVSIVKTTITDNNTIKILIMGTSRTQDSIESVENAIGALNQNLLPQL